MSRRVAGLLDVHRQVDRGDYPVVRILRVERRWRQRPFDVLPGAVQLIEVQQHSANPELYRKFGGAVARSFSSARRSAPRWPKPGAYSPRIETHGLGMNSCS